MLEEKTTEVKVEETPKKKKVVKDNPIPGAPVIDDKVPGEKGYPMSEVISNFSNENRELAKKIEENKEIVRQLNAIRGQSTRKLSTAQVIALTRKTTQRLEAERGQRKIKMQETLKDLDLL